MFVFALFVISFIVYWGICLNKNMWLFIMLYWAVLTMKNWFELLEVIKVYLA